MEILCDSRVRHQTRSGTLIELLFKFFGLLLYTHGHYYEIFQGGYKRLVDILFEQVKSSMKSRWDEIRSRVNETSKDDIPSFEHPDVDRYQQQPCTSEMAHTRARLIVLQGGRNIRVLFAGDDDLVSLRLATLSSIETHVIDKDIRVINLIQEESKKRDIKVITHRSDLQKNIPQQLHGYFDVLFIDPPYDLERTKRFLCNSIHGLKNLGDEKIYLSLPLVLFGDKYSGISKRLEDLGFSQLKLMRDFNEYLIPHLHSYRMKNLNRLLFKSKMDEVYIGLSSFFSDLVIFSRHSA